MPMNPSSRSAKAVLFAAMLSALGCDPQVIDEGDAFRGRRDAYVIPDARIDAWSTDAGMIACADNEACDDGIECNGIESCSGGFCVLGAAPSCADELACTVDVCDLTMGVCVHRAPDGDGDGAADARCVNTLGESLGTDCDDEDARRKPGNLEVCDIEGIDEDCNLDTRGGLDADLDGFEDARCCNPMRATDARPNCGPDCLDSARSVSPMGTETCNGLDDNCSGVVDEICTCSPGVTRPCTSGGVCAAGVQTCTNGLVWSSCSIEAEPTDVCDGRDEDCDGTVDEGSAISCWRDADNDGYSDAGRAPERRCPDPDRVAVGRCPVDYTNRAPVGAGNIDCCDRDRRAFPSQSIYFTIPSYCGGFDFNCDGVSTRQFTTVVDTGRCDLYPTQATCDGARVAPQWLMDVPDCGVGGILSPGCFWFLSVDFNPACVFTPAGEIQSCR
jgi:hypothetical protein